MWSKTTVESKWTDDSEVDVRMREKSVATTCCGSTTLALAMAEAEKRWSPIVIVASHAAFPSITIASLAADRGSRTKSSGSLSY